MDGVLWRPDQRGRHAAHRLVGRARRPFRPRVRPRAGLFAVPLRVDGRPEPDPLWRPRTSLVAWPRRDLAPRRRAAVATLIEGKRLLHVQPWQDRLQLRVRRVGDVFDVGESPQTCSVGNVSRKPAVLRTDPNPRREEQHDPVPGRAEGRPHGRDGPARLPTQRPVPVDRRAALRRDPDGRRRDRRVALGSGGVRVGGQHDRGLLLRPRRAASGAAQTDGDRREACTSRSSSRGRVIWFPVARSATTW